MAGGFLIGSVTSSAALFGKLQQVTAMKINVNPVLTTSANLYGGVMGKLISPQSIAVACAATGLVGRRRTSSPAGRSSLRCTSWVLQLVINDKLKDAESWFVRIFSSNFRNCSEPRW